MLSEAETAELMECLQKSFPKKMHEYFDMEGTGTMLVLKFLSNEGTSLSAGEISSRMKVSTARVTVLIRKMEDKGLVEKKPGKDDARKSMISITPSGLEKLNDHKRKMIELYSILIDKVGKEKFRQFCRLSEEINTAALEAAQMLTMTE